jgi:Zn-dependent protease
MEQEMGDRLLILIYAIPAILISLSFHELSHAYMSYRQGDPTAKMLGRLTLNPLKHLDPIGTLMLIVSMFSGFGFGWAKPVPIDPTYYKNHKRGTVLVSIAGPLANLLLAFIFSFPMALIAIDNGVSLGAIYDSYSGYFAGGLSFQAILFNVSRSFYRINIGLAIFNILPIPPLDGSKILMAVLPAKTYFGIMRYERYIGMAFLVLMVIRPGVLSTLLYPLKTGVEAVFRVLATPVLSLF